MSVSKTQAFPIRFDDLPKGVSLPPGLRLTRLHPEHSAAAARLMQDSFVAREPMSQALASVDPSGGVRRALGEVAQAMMHAAATGDTSLAVVADDGTLAAVCANYPASGEEPPAFPAPVAAIGSLLGALYAAPTPLQAGQASLDIGILAVDARFARRGLATALVRTTLHAAGEAGFDAVTTGATSASQDVFAACGFQAWAEVPYASFRHAGARPFASIPPFSARYPTPAARLMGRGARD